MGVQSHRGKPTTTPRHPRQQCETQIPQHRDKTIPLGLSHTHTRYVVELLAAILLQPYVVAAND
ncbi:hypothetical protein E2C01_068111 [Portunus trituberculatus]|uniref:Uncharacterized protein n=1 Tax=Portunus trituberculatus TaxID=210409 RepID=A0A5B7HZ77_PORTR|nr:hypothetical protein [Portunus trituberculatus]